MFASSYRRLLINGALLWLIGTIALRLTGQRILDPGNPIATAALFLGGALSMALVVRGLCKGAGLAREQWPAGAICVALPTLLLDPFSAAYFPVAFPNIDPSAAGLFGGWMLICCAGALGGVLVGK